MVRDKNFLFPGEGREAGREIRPRRVPGPWKGPLAAHPLTERLIRPVRYLYMNDAGPERSILSLLK